MFKSRSLVAIFFVNFTLLTSAFSQTIITVIDQKNNPLPDAVVEHLFNNSAKSDTSTNNTNIANASTYIMDQIDKSFVPYLLVIPKNSLVSFPNSDDIRHHVYSFSPAKTFELKLYAGQPKSPVMFENEGVVVMGCNIHDSMVGYIYVTNQTDAYITDDKGRALIPENVTANSQIQIWHANAQIGADNRQLFTMEKMTVTDNEITIKVNVNAPQTGDSFEELFSHAH